LEIQPGGIISNSLASLSRDNCAYSSQFGYSIRAGASVRNVRQLLTAPLAAAPNSARSASSTTITWFWYR